MKKLLQLFTILLLVSVYNITYAQPQFWGVTRYGGQYDAGVIFKTNGQGSNQSVQHSLSVQNDGRFPIYSTPIQATDGKLYGMTMGGGVSKQGVLFQYDPSTNVYTKKVDFYGDFNGSSPYGSLMQASNGKLYGMTSAGGSNNIGTLFQYDPVTNTLTKKVDFDYTNGREPLGSLMQASDGKLYGMTKAGGSNNWGVLFQYDPATNVYTKKIDFEGAANGGGPYGSLIQADDGKLYGMTFYGGTNGNGVIFQYDIVTGMLTKKFDFDYNNTRQPPGSLVQAGDGKLYGMTSDGGANGLGIIFQYDYITNIFTKKIDFTAGANGMNPRGSLMKAADGKLYGTTLQGGTNASGVLFQHDPATNGYIKKIDFGGSNGSSPEGSLMQAVDGKLYGMTNQGGTNALGVLFQFDPNTNSMTKKIDFEGDVNGRSPAGSIIRAGDGKLYGMTSEGGSHGKGIIFQFDPTTNAYIKKLDFTGPNGSNPYGSLMQAGDGKLYGMTDGGGTNNMGVFFQYDPVLNVLTKKVDFDISKGRYPQGSLIQAGDGKLYGMTELGGTSDMGVLFQFDPATNLYTKKIDFAGITNGSFPSGSLIQADDGKLYGMTIYGGTNNMGVIFQYDPATNTLTKQIDFVGTANGSNPFGSLIQANDGKLYGMTYQGGVNSVGVLFQYDPASNVFTKKIDFAGGPNGMSPYGSLMQAGNGKLYGMTTGGGTDNLGVLFQYDPVTSIYTKTLDFNGLNGSLPGYSNLIAIAQPQIITFNPLPNKALGDPAFAFNSNSFFRFGSNIYQ